MTDLFNFNATTKKPAIKDNYTAADIEVLEGLEPVRRRPGMYIGGVDENALHHLVNEVLDNAMDEAVSGFATKIEISLQKNNFLTIKDNGRGIPVDPHPKYPEKSALEVIMTMLHSGGKFSNNVYKTSGGLHGVGISVVNALSSFMQVEVVKSRSLYCQKYSRGIPLTDLEKVSEVHNRKGTTITFCPDEQIFGNSKLQAKKIYTLAKSKAYLYKGVEIRWQCDADMVASTPEIPSEDVIFFPQGLKDYLISEFEYIVSLLEDFFCGEKVLEDGVTKVEWAIGWTDSREGYVQSYCNTIPTPLGGTHEQGIRSALLKAIKSYAEMTFNKRATNIIIEDVLSCSLIILSVFIQEPSFQGQTKEKLVSPEASKIVETAIKDRFEQWLTANKNTADKLIEYFILKAEDRINKRNDKNVNRKNILQKLRLPGKLTDCSRDIAKGTELFIVEGDAAGGSAKKARNRETQAILPIKGKILNVASAPQDKIRLNQQINDIEIALACGSLNNYKEDNLRYEKIIIMTDADVDGAHIASLLMTFFFKRIPKLIENGHLYLAKPPLYKLTQGEKIYYATNDLEKDKLIAKLTKNSKLKVELGRFKGLGEMNADQLKDTTMDPRNRTLIKIKIDNESEIESIVNDLMGNKPEKRYKFICEQSLNNINVIKDNLDI